MEINAALSACASGVARASGRIVTPRAQGLTDASLPDFAPLARLKDLNLAVRVRSVSRILVSCASQFNKITSLAALSPVRRAMGRCAGRSPHHVRRAAR